MAATMLRGMLKQWRESIDRASGMMSMLAFRGRERVVYCGHRQSGVSVAAAVCVLGKEEQLVAVVL